MTFERTSSSLRASRFIAFGIGGLLVSSIAIPAGNVLGRDKPEPALTVLSVAASPLPQYLRITNTERMSAPATVTIRNVSGQTVGTWNSPTIASNAAPTFAVSQILDEAAVADRSGTLTFIVATTFDGYAQTIAVDAASGVLTNTSSCSRQYFDRDDEFASGAMVSTTNGGGSELQFHNEKKKARTARLNVYNATTGALLGDVTTQSIPARSTSNISVASLIANASFANSLTPTTTLNLEVLTDDIEIVHALRSGTVAVDLSVGCEFDNDVTLAQLDQR